jgi:hypothetical protein
MEVTVSNIEERSKEIIYYWKDLKHWVPKECYEKVVLPNLDRHIQLTSFLEIWGDKNKRNNIESHCLAYSVLAELTEGWLRLAYCIYYVNCKLKDIHPNEPEKMSFTDLTEFARGKYWGKETEIDRFIERLKSFIKYIEKEDKRLEICILRIVTNLYSDLSIYKEFIEEIDIRLPYPDRG